MDAGINEILKNVEKESDLIKNLLDEIGKRIIGQQNMVEKLLLGILTGGHILLEGVPGLAKTLAVSTLAEVIDADFKRIQFTPDLLPSDLIGTLIYSQKTGEFDVKKGPIFTNIVLADEINRAPAKVQSALLEAMQEKQVTIGDTTYKLNEPFLVLATENPIEQEGTYPLPEAQVDRFMLKVIISYPQRTEEKEIIKKNMTPIKAEVKKIINSKKVAQLRDVVNSIYIDEKVLDYIVSIVFATREPETKNIEKDLLAYGASPRASIYLAMAGKANAFLKGRAFVTPEDIRMVGYDVLRHRVIPSYEAEAEGISAEDLIEKVFNSVEVP